MDRINRKLVAFWGTDLHIMGRTYNAEAIEEAWWATAFSVVTGTGLAGCIIQAILK